MNKELKEILFSDYGIHSRKPAPINKLMSSFASDFRQGYDINLGVGYVNEDTIPKDLIKKALDKVFSDPDKYRCSLNYGGPRGSANLINSIRNYYLTHTPGGVGKDILKKRDIIIGPSGATSILEGICDIIKPGIVITSDPMYYIYCHLLERKGFKVVTIPEDSHGINTGLVEEKCRTLDCKSIRFFYIVTINNPTSTILSNTRRKEIVSLAHRLSRESGQKIPVFFDKAYEDLIHDPAVRSVKSGLLHDELGLVYELGTLSKILAPGLRIGYMIGKNGPLLQTLVQKTNDVGFSAPMICQEIASYILDHYIDKQIKKVNAGYRRKALAVKDAMERMLGPFVSEYRGGSAGFYYYLTLDGVKTCEGSPFFRYVTRTTGKREIDGLPGKKNPVVIYIPGEFCVHPLGDMREAGNYQLRISYGYEETGRIIQAINIMKQAIEAGKV